MISKTFFCFIGENFCSALIGKSVTRERLKHVEDEPHFGRPSTSTDDSKTLKGRCAGRRRTLKLYLKKTIMTVWKTGKNVVKSMFSQSNLKRRKLIWTNSPYFLNTVVISCK